MCILLGVRMCLFFVVPVHFTVVLSCHVLSTHGTVRNAISIPLYVKYM